MIFLSCSKTVEEQKTSTYYLIRHAEKDRSNPDDKDPHLNELGVQRALKWASTLKHVNFDAFYSTKYNRTKETTQPSAELHQKEITIYDPNNIDIHNFLKNTNGKTILIVGHSNTIPNLVNKLIDQEKYDQINDLNNSNLYIVCRQKEVISDALLVID